jgi:hypothetical protein
LQGKFQLSESDKAGLTWKKLECEATGIANLACLVTIGEQSNKELSMFSQKENAANVGASPPMK